MKKVLFVALLVAGMMATAQKAEAKVLELVDGANALAAVNAQTTGNQVAPDEEEYYIYNFVYLSGDIKNEGLKADIDDGVSIERVKDAEGKTIKFRTPAAVMIHFAALGWEFVTNGDTLYSGGDSTRSYWVLRKKCTKEEMLAAVKAGRKRADSSHHQRTRLYTNAGERPLGNEIRKASLDPAVRTAFLDSREKQCGSVPHRERAAFNVCNLVYLKAFLMMFQMQRSTTAPITALTIWPYHCAQNGLVAPSFPSSQPPTKPPARPMMMFQMRPPFSLATKKPESQPATAPMSNVMIMFIVLQIMI